MEKSRKKMSHKKVTSTVDVRRLDYLLDQCYQGSLTRGQLKKSMIGEMKFTPEEVKIVFAWMDRLADGYRSSQPSARELLFALDSELEKREKPLGGSKYLQKLNERRSREGLPPLSKEWTE